MNCRYIIIVTDNSLNETELTSDLRLITINTHAHDSFSYPPWHTRQPLTRLQMCPRLTLMLSKDDLLVMSYRRSNALEIKQENDEKKLYIWNIKRSSLPQWQMLAHRVRLCNKHVSHSWIFPVLLYPKSERETGEKAILGALAWFHVANYNF